MCHSNRFLSSLAQGAGAGSLLAGGGVVPGGGGGQEDAADGTEILTPVFLPLPRLNKVRLCRPGLPTACPRGKACR